MKTLFEIIKEAYKEGYKNYEIIEAGLEAYNPDSYANNIMHQYQKNTMKIKTAVEFLEERLKLSFGDELKPLRGFFVIAKETEEEQIKEAWIKGFKSAENKPLEEKTEAELYYKEKFLNLKNEI